MNHYNLDEKYAIKLEKVCKFIDEYRKKKRCLTGLKD